MFASMAEQRRYIHNTLASNKTLVLAVFSKEHTIVRDGVSHRSIYGTWEAVLKDINLDHFKHVIIKVY